MGRFKRFEVRECDIHDPETGIMTCEWGIYDRGTGLYHEAVYMGWIPYEDNPQLLEIMLNDDYFKYDSMINDFCQW